MVCVMKIRILEDEINFYTDELWDRKEILQEAEKCLKDRSISDNITIFLNPQTLLESKKFDSDEEFLYRNGKLYETQPSLFNLSLKEME